MASMEEPMSGLSLVSTILKKSSEKENIHIEDSLQRVQKKCSQLKVEITEFLQHNYVKFTSFSNNALSLEQRLKEVSSDYQRLSSLVENSLNDRLTKSAGKREEIERQFKETELKITFVASLMEIHNKINLCHQELKRGNHTLSANLIRGIVQLINVVGGMGCDAKVFRALKEEICYSEADLKYELFEKWSTYLYWGPSVGKGSPELDKSLALSVTHFLPKNSPEFVGVVSAMTRLLSKEEWRDRVNRYAGKLLEKVLKPLLVHEGLRLRVREEEGEVGKVRVSLEEEEEGGREGEGKEMFLLVDVLNDMLVLFSTVSDMMGSIEDIKWMEYIGETIEPDLYQLIKNRLSLHSPKTSSERDHYTTLSTTVTHFEEQLKTLSLFPSTYTSLSSFTNKVDVHIITEQCQERLGKARSLLLLPLHDTIPVNSQDTLTALEKLDILPNSTVNTSLPEDIRSISLSTQNLESLTFLFPSCLISKSIKEFIALLYETLLECTRPSLPVATVTQLIHTARNMVDLFIAISHNRDRGLTTGNNTVPRNALVIHNNYMYVAHHLITIGHQFSSKIFSSPNEKTLLTFVDFVPRLRQLGEESFLAEMDRETAIILNFIKPISNFDEISSNVAKQEELSQCVKQSFLHIFKLSKIYTEVLPQGLQVKCKSGLLEVLVNELVSRTLAVQDFSVDDGTFLHDFFTNDVIEKCPHALSLSSKEFESISSLCSSWERLKATSFILKATQDDIVREWVEGSLSTHLNTVEVKHLIKASFKNTQRRADNLAKIT